MNRIIIAIFLTFNIINAAFTQSIRDELRFYYHLEKIKNYDEAILQLRQLEMQHKISSDSLHYFMGKNYYRMQNLKAASHHFNYVNNRSSPIYTEAHANNAFVKSNLSFYDSAILSITDVHAKDVLEQSLINFEMAGIYLLKRDFDKFDTYAQNFSMEYFQLAEQEKSYLEIAADLQSHRYKSPALAGMYSAIIPGAGKMYAGKIGVGIASLLTATVLGLQTWEGYRKDGNDSPRFLIFGSLFSLYYISNIWGSVLSVKIVNEEFNHVVNQKILLDMHIPLRSIFE